MEENTPELKSEVRDSTSSKSNRGLKIGMVLLLVLALVATYFGVANNKKAKDAEQKLENLQKASVSPSPTANSQTSSASPTSTVSPTNPITQIPKINGTLTLLNQDLKLFVADSQLEGAPIQYFQAGILTAGKYQGYTRVVATRSTIDPGGPSTYTFLTKDFKTYVLSDDPALATEYNGLIYGVLDKKLVTSVEKVDVTLPDTLIIDQNYSLYGQGLATHSQVIGQTSNGDKSIENIVTDFSAYSALKSPYADLKFYGKKYDQITDTTDLKIYNYLSGGSEVYVVDSTGLVRKYSLSTPVNILTFTTLKPKGVSADLNFKNSDITTSESLFNTYNSFITSGCGSNLDTAVVQNIADTELTKIGTKSGQDIYKLKDANHTLLKYTYNLKVSEIDDSTFKEMRPGETKPTYEQYVAKNPLLLMRDSWGRLLILQEWDYVLPGGCGKPVVYLYPTKTEQVSVKFDSPMKFDTDIPTYDNGWKVLASPSGVLKDLQPTLTDCDKLKKGEFGSEYAYKACKNQTYPYLYWAGQAFNGGYETPTDGWVVAKADLATFLDSKLTEVGLNSKEKADFLEYWVPTLVQKNMPFYRISFLQNEEMNKVAPMSITPQPDTVYRLFMDYKGLDALPSKAITPQNLKKLVRNGFTIVEWGGLKY